MICHFHVGQKVVCINDEFEAECFDEVPYLPVKGSVYTVRSIELMTATTGDRSPIIWLVEIVNPVMPWEIGDVEIGFVPGRFRPLVKRKTDISQFQAMLNYRPKVVVLS